jgi:MraZ protein
LGGGSNPIRRFSYRDTEPRQRGAGHKVARVFRGEFHQKVDGKGRVSIPASFRRVIEAEDPDWESGKRPKFVIVYGDNRRHHLECFSISAMREVDERITAMPRGSAARRAMEVQVYTLSQEAEVDEDGRIVLPQKLRDKIGLDGEAYFAGTADTFQIWKPETYTAEEKARLDALMEELPEGADVFSLLPELPGREA